MNVSIDKQQNGLFLKNGNQNHWKLKNEGQKDEYTELDYGNAEKSIF